MMRRAYQHGLHQYERGLLLGVLLLVFALASVVATRLSQPRAGRILPIAERKPVPAIALTDTTGHTWSILQHRNQVVLINYWATWCGPCMDEAPGIVELTKELSPNDLAIVGVSLDAGGDTTLNRSKVASFVNRYHLNYPIAFPPKGSQFEFGMAGIPTTLLVDRQGRVAKIYEGAVRRAVFKSDIETLLTEQ